MMMMMMNCRIHPLFVLLKPLEQVFFIILPSLIITNAIVKFPKKKSIPITKIKHAVSWIFVVLNSIQHRSNSIGKWSLTLSAKKKCNGQIVLERNQTKPGSFAAIFARDAQDEKHISLTSVLQEMLCLVYRHI